MLTKKTFIVTLLLIVSALLTSCFSYYIRDEGFTDRTATEVKSVLTPGNIDYFLLPDEEYEDDHQVSNAPECDIKAGAACYDKDQLRFDIIVYNKILKKVATFFGIKVQYIDGYELYLYFPSSNEFFIYYYDENGAPDGSEEVDMDTSSDFAQVNDWDKEESVAVTIIIDKDKHIAKVGKGKSIFLTVRMISGFISKSNKLEKADETEPVNVYFKR